MEAAVSSVRTKSIKEKSVETIQKALAGESIPCLQLLNGDALTVRDAVKREVFENLGENVDCLPVDFEIPCGKEFTVLSMADAEKKGIVQITINL